jgi:hypothetical protein
VAREDSEIVASQLADLTRAVEKLTAEWRRYAREPTTRKIVRTLSRNASTSLRAS